VLTNVHRSLAERVQQLEAAVIVLAGEQQRQRVLLAVQGTAGNSRGAWHAQALSLREQGKTGNQIARLLGKSLNAVEKVLSRKARTCDGAATTPSGYSANLHKYQFGGRLAGGFSHSLRREKSLAERLV
jgi:hypothetical protein